MPEPLTLTFPLPDELTDKGIAKVELADGKLTVTGWYDQFAAWVAEVEFDEEQIAALHEATRP